MLIIGKFVAFFATFSGLIGHIEVAKLIDSVAVALPNSQYLPYILMTLPFCIISFGFHGNVPSPVKLYGTSGVRILRVRLSSVRCLLCCCIFSGWA